MLSMNNLLPWLSTAIFVLAGQVNANTIYLVRHGEKLPHGNDPVLSACGMARAETLARYFSDIPLNAVYATPYQRTQLTAAAVASSKQLRVTSYDPRQPQQLIQQLKLQSQPVLVVGHSNTVPQLATLLSGIAMAELTEQDYGLLYRVELGTQPSVTLMRQAFTCDKPAVE